MKTKFVWLLSAYLLAGVESFSTAGSVRAAESVVLQYGVLQGSISVEELSTFARSGKLSSSLKNYLELANRKPEDVQKLLTREIDVNGIFLYRSLNSIPGEIVLDRVGEIIRTPSGRASRESLRAALVSSALSDNKIALIEVIENYPTSEVHIEGGRLADAYNSIRRGLEIASRLGF
ncbi:MAG: alpha/beta hydrolase [Xenococcaceae cyanobacterium]